MRGYTTHSTNISDTHLQYTYPTNISWSHSMGRRRAAESVPAVEDGIQEVLIEHRQTRRGVRTTAKAVPILKPAAKKPGQPSRSKKGKQRQVDPEQMEGDASEGHLPTMEDTQEYQFIDGQVDDLPDLEREQGQPQANVSTGSHLP